MFVYIRCIYTYDTCQCPFYYRPSLPLTTAVFTLYMSYLTVILLYTYTGILSDKSQCPFFFTDDMARVISGEEEAIYSWAAGMYTYVHVYHSMLV